MARDLLQSLKSKLQTLKIPEGSGADTPTVGGLKSWQTAGSLSRRDSGATSVGHQSDTPGTASRFASPVPGASPRLSRAFSHASSQASRCSRLRKEYGLETGAWLWDHEAKTITFYRFSTTQLPGLLSGANVRTLGMSKKREAMRSLPETRIHIKDSSTAASGRAIRRKGVITLHDVKAVAFKEIQGHLSVPKPVCRALISMEESDKLLVSLINYFQSYQRSVAAKRKFRFEQETRHVELFYDFLREMSRLNWSGVSSSGAQNNKGKQAKPVTPASITEEVGRYENTKYLYPFPVATFQVLDALLEKSFHLLKAYKSSCKGPSDLNQEKLYRTCKEKLNSLVKQRGEEKREFQATLQALQPGLNACVRMASDDYRRLLSTGTLYSVPTENAPRGSLKTSQYDSTFEFYVRFLSLAVWISLERQDYESIHKEADSLFGCSWDPELSSSAPGKDGAAGPRFVQKLSKNVSRLYQIQLERRALMAKDNMAAQYDSGMTPSIPSHVTVGILGQPCQFFNEALERHGSSASTNAFSEHS